jgi:hypothetical protein
MTIDNTKSNLPDALWSNGLARIDRHGPLYNNSSLPSPKSVLFMKICQQPPSKRQSISNWQTASTTRGIIAWHQISSNARIARTLPSALSIHRYVYLVQPLLHSLHHNHKMAIKMVSIRTTGTQAVHDQFIQSSHSQFREYGSIARSHGKAYHMDQVKILPM